MSYLFSSFWFFIWVRVDGCCCSVNGYQNQYKCLGSVHQWKHSLLFLEISFIIEILYENKILSLIFCHTVQKSLKAVFRQFLRVLFVSLSFFCHVENIERWMRAEMQSILFSSLLKTLWSLFVDCSGFWTSKNGERCLILPVFCFLHYENKWIKKACIHK